MGKHKNKNQNAIFLEFMEKYPDIAKGYSKRDKASVDSLWNNLAQALNNEGPPEKDVNGWKKIWTEWKSDIKRKLSHNKSECRATGGGPFANYQLSQTEEAIIRLCSITRSAKGDSGIALGETGETIEGEDDEMPSTSRKRKSESPTLTNTPKRAATQSTAQRLKTFLDDDNKTKIELNEKFDELIKIEKENASSLRRIYRAIEKNNDSTTRAITELKNEFVSVTSRILKTMQEKNEIKKQQLDLDIMKLDLQKSTNYTTM